MSLNEVPNLTAPIVSLRFSIEKETIVKVFVTVRSRSGLRMQESWMWTWTRLYGKTYEKVFWLLT